MALLYDREWSVYVDDLKITGLRIKFKADKTLKSDPNTLDLHVYNLSTETRAKIQTKGVTVIVIAGYKGEGQVIFSGNARTIDHVKGPGPEWDTHIQCGDGEVAYRTALSSFSFSPGASWKDVVGKLASDMKVKAGDALAKVRSGNFSGAIDAFLGGYTANGPTVRELDKVMKAAGLEWSIQDGKLLILKSSKPTDEGAILLSPSTGLVGSPDHGAPEKDGSPSLLKARAFLQAGLRPGRTVKIETKTIKGFYRCERVTHEGDSHGAEWYSSLECLPL